MNLIPSRTVVDASFLILLAVFMVGGIAYSFMTVSESTSTAAEDEGDRRVEEPIAVDPFDGVDIAARSAIVYDIAREEVLYEKHADAPLPLASLTKVMTAMTARELLGDRAPVRISQDAIQVDGDSGLYVGETWQAENLLAFSLLTSSNDGIEAVGNNVHDELKLNLVRVMNNKADSLGLSTMEFNNTTGLDVSVEDGVSGGYASAREYARLLTYGLENHYGLLGATAQPEERYPSGQFSHTATNTNIVAERIPSLLISKTGYTDLAGGNLAVVFEKEPNHPVAVVVLGSSRDDRFNDVEELVWASIKN